MIIKILFALIIDRVALVRHSWITIDGDSFLSVDHQFCTQHQIGPKAEVELLALRNSSA